MTTVEFTVMVAGFAIQVGGLGFLGVLVYRQGRGLAATLARMAERVSPGEAAIILQQQRLMTRFEEVRTPAPERGGA